MALRDRVITAEQIEIAKKNGIGRSTLYNRVVNYGWDIDRAMTTPIKNSKQNAQDASDVAKKNRFSKKSSSWFADGNNSVLKCPVPGCGHTAQIITKAHCRIAHGMEREEVRKLYGMPTRVDTKIRKKVVIR